MIKETDNIYIKYNKLEANYKELTKINCSLNMQIKNLKAENESLKKQIKNFEIKTQELIDKSINLVEVKFNKIIAAKDKEIARLNAIINNDSTNSGLPTSMTPLSKNKRIPNTRQKTDKKIGGQLGHLKYKLKKFNDDEVTEIQEHIEKVCPNCGSKDIKVLETSIIKDEIDYEVKLISRRHKFNNYSCPKCGETFHALIPENLKEENQYGSNVQALCVTLTNEIYTPFNKSKKLLSGMTNNTIEVSEGYIVKLQLRASKLLSEFIINLRKEIIKQNILYWDETNMIADKKRSCLRFYGTEKLAFFTAHTNKNKDSIDLDGVLSNLKNTTFMMHDHVLLNYNKEYSYNNIECMIHLIRRLIKMKENTNNHSWCIKLINLLSKTNDERNKLLLNNILSFDKLYLEKVNKEYDDLILLGFEESKQDKYKYFDKEENHLLDDLIKYKNSYLLWIENFALPSTNNLSERSLRPIKSKMKISGQFKNIDYAEYHATIRSYIETCKRNNINVHIAVKRLLEKNPYTLEEILTYNV
ncbi:MAG: transposase [Bacilli bacterium]